MDALSLLVKSVELRPIIVEEALLGEVLSGRVIQFDTGRDFVLDSLFSDIVKEMVVSLGLVVEKIDEEGFVIHELDVDEGVVEA